MRFIFKYIQVEYGAITNRQFTDKLHQHLLRNSIHCRSIRFFVRFGYVIQSFRLVYYIILAQVLQRRIHHNTLHPRPQGSITSPSEFIKRIEELQETIVHEVFCCITVTRIAKTHAEHPPCIALVQLLPGKVVALPAPSCQFLFFHSFL